MTQQDQRQKGEPGHRQWRARQGAGEAGDISHGRPLRKGERIGEEACETQGRGQGAERIDGRQFDDPSGADARQGLPEGACAIMRRASGGTGGSSAIQASPTCASVSSPMGAVAD